MKEIYARSISLILCWRNVRYNVTFPSYEYFHFAWDTKVRFGSTTGLTSEILSWRVIHSLLLLCKIIFFLLIITFDAFKTGIEHNKFIANADSTFHIILLSCVVWIPWCNSIFRIILNTVFLFNFLVQFAPDYCTACPIRYHRARRHRTWTTEDSNYFMENNTLCS